MGEVALVAGCIPEPNKLEQVAPSPKGGEIESEKSRTGNAIPCEVASLNALGTRGARAMVVANGLSVPFPGVSCSC